MPGCDRQPYGGFPLVDDSSPSLFNLLASHADELANSHFSTRRGAPNQVKMSASISELVHDCTDQVRPSLITPRGCISEWLSG